MSNSRYCAYLRERYSSLGAYIGLLFVIIGLIIISPIALLLAFPTESDITSGFLWPGLILAAIGLALWFVLKTRLDGTLSIAEGAAVVVIAWSAAVIVGAVPFYWSGMNVTQAVFESTSGWTTTGLSVADLSHMSPLLLFFRSLMQLAGGAGLAIIMLSTIGGPLGAGLSAAEGRSEQLVPHVRQSARIVIKLYGVYILLGFTGLMISGMGWFDAVNHSFCAVSTGGFSTRVDSVGFWNSPAVEVVLMILMILGATNFLTIYTLCQGHWITVVRNGELRIMGILLPLSAMILIFCGSVFVYRDSSEQVRLAIFQTVSALSTTGYATASMSVWNGVGLLIITVLMLIGGGSGSTAGGIKQHRIYLAIKGLKRDLTEAFMPEYTVREEVMWAGNRRGFLKESELRKGISYIVLYLFIWLIGSCALTAFGHPPLDSLFEFASALGTVGLSVGVTCAEAASGQLWVEIAGMLLGRLEFFVIFWGVVKIGKDLSTCMISQR